jgi:hypothetical protein
VALFAMKFQEKKVKRRLVDKSLDAASVWTALLDYVATVQLNAPFDLFRLSRNLVLDGLLCRGLTRCFVNHA